MAQVPYEGAPTVQPRDEPTPTLAINAIPAAFGVDVAQAIGHMGQVQEGAGKELFDRAYAMQELNAHINATAVASDVQNAHIAAELAFRQKQGKDAVDAYPALQSQVDQIRQDATKNLPPYERMLVETDVRNSANRVKFSAGMYASDQQKSYVNSTSKAAVDSSINASGSSLDDPAAFDSYIKKIKDEGNQAAAVNGFPVDNPKHILDVKIDTSRAYERRISALADEARFKEANDLMKKGTDSGDLVSTGTDIYGRTSLEHLQNYIQDKERTVGVRHAVSEANNGHTGYGDGIVTMPQAMVGVKAVESSGGDYGAVGPTVPLTKDHPSGNGLGAYQVMSYNLSPWLKEAGMPDMTPDQFRGDRQAQDQLFAFKFGQLMQEYKSYNAALHGWFGWGKTDGYSTADAYIAKARAAIGQPVDAEGQARILSANRAMARTAPASERVAAAQDIMRQSGGDDESVMLAGDAMTVQINKERSLQTDTNRENYDAVESFVLNGANGVLPTSVEEIGLNPQAKQAYDYLTKNDPEDQKRIRNLLASNVGKGPPDSDAWANSFSHLSGMSVTDPDKFMKETEDLSKFPHKYRTSIVDWRRKITKDENTQPDVARALRIPGIAKQLSDLSITKESDPDTLNLFAAELGDEIAAQTKDGGRPPDQAKTEEIATKLLQQTATGERSLLHPMGGATKPFFQFGAAYDWAVQTREVIQKTLGYTPSDQEIDRWWNQQQYQLRYGKPTPKLGAPQ